MSTSLLPSLWAVHIADGVLAPSWLAGGVAGALLLALVAVAVEFLLVGLRLRPYRPEEIAEVALLTAAFFVASLIHVRVGPTSVHLLLVGLMGVLLGWRSAVAIPVALFLQFALLGHGGFSTLGVNSCVMVLPALLAWGLFAGLRRLPWVREAWFRSLLVSASVAAWLLCLVYSVVLLCTNYAVDLAALDPTTATRVTCHPLTLAAVLVLAGLAAWVERRLEHAPEFALGLVVGETAVLATILLNCVALIWGGKEDWHTLALVVFVAHLPIAAVEGVIVGFTVGFLARVKPEMLGWAVAETPHASLDLPDLPCPALEPAGDPAGSGERTGASA